MIGRLRRALAARWTAIKLRLDPVTRRLARVLDVLRPLRPAWRVARALLLALGAVLAVTLVASVWGILAVEPVHPPAPAVVNDVTQLNPIRVARVATPRSTAEVVEAVRSTTGPISIGGGRFSMGGQTAAEGALQLDMRQMDRILALDTAARTITVQAGIRWRAIQEAIDPAGLSVKIMQTYANFTVGGSLSVNAHGRYVGQGPLILSVRGIRVVLADGTEVAASPTERSDVFYGVIGGYGGIGVITEVSLDLAENVRVKRTDRRMPLAEYREWFLRHVRDSADVIFHNADIYPDEYDRVNAVSYTRTDDPVTVPDRLIPRDRSYRVNRAGYWAVSELWGGKEIREHVIDPLLFRGEPVTWRNYEASYDVAELEPSSREDATYVLQEYFVPIAQLETFVARMGAILRAHKVNAINVSIRHARQDPGSLLAWARTEVFAFVLYYKQGTKETDRAEVGRWTRELIDAAIDEGGAYYLPYQVHATEAQFLAAYPRAPEYLALKRRLDPTYRLRNTLWDAYVLPHADPRAVVTAAARAQLDSIPDYRRPEEQTFLAHPEWYIVYSSDEYADWMQTRQPTAFPYIRSIGGYWAHFAEMRRATAHRAFNEDYSTMLWVIGVSYTAEFALKGLYENTVGRVSGWTSGGRLVEEDRFAAGVARDYGRFIKDRPWYEYDFTTALRRLWGSVPIFGDFAIRKFERRLFLTVEFGVKLAYAKLIGVATHSTSAPQAEVIGLVVSGDAAAVARLAAVAAAHGGTPTPAAVDSLHARIEVARYRLFTEFVLDAARDGAPPRLTEIAGNDEIVVTGTAPAGWRLEGDLAEHLYSIALPIDASRDRFTLLVRARDLLPLVRRLQGTAGIVVDHAYDY